MPYTPTPLAMHPDSPLFQSSSVQWQGYTPPTVKVAPGIIYTRYISGSKTPPFLFARYAAIRSAVRLCISAAHSSQYHVSTRSYLHRSGHYTVKCYRTSSAHHHPSISHTVNMLTYLVLKPPIKAAISGPMPAITPILCRSSSYGGAENI